MTSISVLMCVYNRERYVSEAIESILNQSFRDFEFVIVVDGATDRSLEIVQSYAVKDARIIVLVNDENIGITRSNSKGLLKCQGRYIARMDSDDISLPDRLQIQFDHLETHPEIDVLGSACKIINEKSEDTGDWISRPMDPLVIRYEMHYFCAIHNPTVMARSSIYKKYNHNHLEEPHDSAEDYAFLTRVNFDHYFSNLPECLLLTRHHSGQISIAKINYQRESFLSVSHRSFESLLGKRLPKEAVKAFYFSERYTENDPIILQQGLRIMLQAHRKFEKEFRLIPDQRSEIRSFFYTKFKRYIMVYRKNSKVLLTGVLSLVLFFPGTLMKDLLTRIRKTSP